MFGITLLFGFVVSYEECLKGSIFKSLRRRKLYLMNFKCQIIFLLDTYLSTDFNHDTKCSAYFYWYLEHVLQIKKVFIRDILGE